MPSGQDGADGVFANVAGGTTITIDLEGTSDATLFIAGQSAAALQDDIFYG
ncbi:MAG: hypothetical protein NW203_15705 [Hyphomonadaceae bacterium]|nr:hypothetical protein [Hyphomonadaceae bacterium]